MRVERLEEGLVLASDCPAPDRSAALCEELRSWGVASLLEVRDFIDPIAQRVHASLWCFKSPLNELDAVSSFEQQVIRDFVRYELARTRSVALWAENDAVRDAVVSEAVAEARRDTSSRSLNPNPPKDTDGRREDSGRGWVRELQGRWPGVLG